MYKSQTHLGSYTICNNSRWPYHSWYGNIRIWHRQCTKQSFVCNWLSSCFAIAIRVDFRKTFGGSISIRTQCIEPQLKPNESSRKDLQIMCWSLLCQISPSWCNLRHKVSTSVKLFLLTYSSFFFFFLLATFVQIVRKFSRETASRISVKLHMYAHG